MERRFGNGLLVLKQGDITGEHADAVVNAANGTLMGGGGVDGAIHRRGGPRILEECKLIRKELGGHLPTGSAVITTGGDLPARYVIHTVGPVFDRAADPDAQLADAQLADAYRSSLRVAAERGLATIAFPSISTGAYGFPVRRAADLATHVVGNELASGSTTLEEARFILFSEEDLRTYEAALAEMSLD